MSRYASARSRVHVTYQDDTEEVFGLTASHKIAAYLMEQAGQTGVLTLRDDDADVSVCIPLTNVKKVKITPEETPDEKETD